MIGDPHSLTDEQRNALRAHYTDAEIVELTLGVGLFLAMSKVLINLGLEPESMPTTLMPTPGS
jgi:alkylhydroperoxidase family enzyme